MVFSFQNIPTWEYCQCHTLLPLHHYQSSQMLFHLHHIHHQCSPALTKLSDSSSDLYHLHEKKRETNITKPSFLTVGSLKKNFPLAQMPYTLACDAHTTKSCLKMRRGENIVTLQKINTGIETEFQWCII